jgi:hypothetical protein
MSNQRRVIIILVSVFAGTGLSYLVFRLKRGGQELTQHDLLTLWTNFGFSILIILGVGFFFLWNKKKDL